VHYASILYEENMSTPNKRPYQLFSPVNVIPVVIMLLAIAVVPNLLFYVFKDREVSSSVRTILYIFLGIMLGAIVLRSFLNYLEPLKTLKPFEIKDSENEPPSYTSEIISKQFDEIKEQIKSIGTVTFDVKDISKDQLIESLRSTFDERLTENVFKSIDEEFAQRELQNKQWERFITGFEEIRKRLYEETNNLARRANLNLGLGSLTTILAGVGLVTIVFIKPLELANLTNDKGWIITAHYIPRLSVIVFAELFAYFFLRLYKSGLADIKYYQNELTNVELKISALKAALAVKDNELLKIVIGELAKVERNFILKKNETTVEIEKIKTEHLNTKEWLEHLTALLGTKK
jgi:hypothetical protein